MNEQAPPIRDEHRIGRRSLMIAGVGVGGLAVGAAAAEVSSRMTTPAAARSTLPATEDLMNDHGLLKRLLLIYRKCSQRLRTGDTLDPKVLFQSAQLIHDYIEGFHEGIEEGYIFPILLRAGKLTDTVRTLLIQHGRGRTITIAIIQASSTMSSAMATDPMNTGGMEMTGAAPGFATNRSRQRLADQLDAFVRMYEPHEAREDTVVFPTFREVCPENSFRRISEQVADAQQRSYGDDGFANLVNQVARHEKQLGIYRLDQFTPPVA